MSMCNFNTRKGNPILSERIICIMEMGMYNLKSGDKVVLDNDDCNIYEISHYCNIGNGYVCKCGKSISGSLILRFATDEEIMSGRKYG